MQFSSLKSDSAEISRDHIFLTWHSLIRRSFTDDFSIARQLMLLSVFQCIYWNGVEVEVLNFLVTLTYWTHITQYLGLKLSGVTLKPWVIINHSSHRFARILIYTLFFFYEPYCQNKVSSNFKVSRAKGFLNSFLG